MLQEFLSNGLEPIPLTGMSSKLRKHCFNILILIPSNKININDILTSVLCSNFRPYNLEYFLRVSLLAF